MAVHPTALVAPDAQLGPDVCVGPFAVIEARTQIGAGCEIRAYAVVKQFTSLGAGCVVHENAVLGGEPQDLSYSGADSRLLIGERCRVREGATINRAATPGGETRVGEDCYVMAGAHVGHDCVVGNRVILGNNVLLAGHVRIEDDAFLSGGVGVHQFCRVGRLAMIGGITKLVQDALPFVTTDGNPGRARGLNVVGLRRAGVTASELRVLKQAHQILLRSGLGLDTALSQLAGLDDPRVAELAAFARTARRGFAHPAADA